MMLQWIKEKTYLQKVVVINTKVSTSIITHGQVLKEIFYISTKLFFDLIVVLNGFRNNIDRNSQFVWNLFIYLGVIAVHNFILRLSWGLNHHWIRVHQALNLIISTGSCPLRIGIFVKNLLVFHIFYCRSIIRWLQCHC